MNMDGIWLGLVVRRTESVFGLALTHDAWTHVFIFYLTLRNLLENLLSCFSFSCYTTTINQEVDSVMVSRCQDLSFCVVVFRILCSVLSVYVHSSFILALVFPSNVPVFMFTLYFHSPSQPHAFDCFRVKWFPYYLPSALV